MCIHMTIAKAIFSPPFMFQPAAKCQPRDSASPPYPSVSPEPGGDTMTQCCHMVGSWWQVET